MIFQNNVEKKEPLVSVCIPTYNGYPFLEYTLDSLFNQTYENIEIVVIDNASTDDTNLLINKYKNNNNFKYLRNKKNIGGANFNKALLAGNGNYIAIFHSDDIYKPEIISKQMRTMEEYKEIAAVFTMGYKIDENNKVIGKYNIPRKLKNKTIFSFKDIFEEFLINGNSFLLCPSFFLKKDIINNIGIFPPYKFRTGGDVEYWFRILSRYKIAILDEKLMKRRISKFHDSFRHNYLRTARSDFFCVMNYCIKKYAPDFNNQRILRQYKFQKSFDNLRRSFYLLIYGNINKSNRLILKSISRDTFIAVFQFFNFKKLLKYILMLIFLFIFKIKFEKLLRLLLIKVKYRKIINT